MFRWGFRTWSLNQISGSNSITPHWCPLPLWPRPNLMLTSLYWSRIGAITSSQCLPHCSAGSTARRWYCGWSVLIDGSGTPAPNELLVNLAAVYQNMRLKYLVWGIVLLLCPLIGECSNCRSPWIAQTSLLINYFASDYFVEFDIPFGMSPCNQVKCRDLTLITQRCGNFDNLSIPCGGPCSPGSDTSENTTQ